MNTYNTFIKDCYDKGYRVNLDGDVISPKGYKRKLYLNKKGYYSFGHKMFGERMTIYVHNLCAYQKFGDKCFRKDLEVRHFDNNSKNNTPSNILIGTHTENMLDIPKEKRVKTATYASDFITKHDHEKIKKYYNNNKVSYNDIMEKFNISSKGTVSYIINKDS